MHWSRRSKNVEIVEKRIFAVFHVAFPSVHGQQSTLSPQMVPHNSACAALHHLIFLVQQLERKLGKKTNLLISQG
jgi:hypothetical protein